MSLRFWLPIALCVLAPAFPTVADEVDKLQACIEQHGQAETAACTLLFGPMPATGSAVLFIGLGNARESKGDAEGALAAYNRAIEIEPANPAGWDGRAQLYFNKLQQPEKAIETYEAGIAATSSPDVKRWLEDRLMAVKQKMNK